MKEKIAGFFESYSWQYLFYNDETNLFSLAKYHCSSIDDAEEFFDGEEQITQAEALKGLIKYGQLPVIRAYWAALRADEYMDMVLDGFRQAGQTAYCYDQNAYKLCAHEHFTYYQLPADEYIIYWCKNYFSVKHRSMPEWDPTAVRRIFDQYDGVIYWKYNYGIRGDGKGWEQIRLAANIICDDR